MYEIVREIKIKSLTKPMSVIQKYETLNYYKDPQKDLYTKLAVWEHAVYKHNVIWEGFKNCAIRIMYTTLTTHYKNL